MPNKKFGLIGKTLKHSFSQKYFTEKFEKENIKNSEYHLFELETIDKVKDLFNLEGLKGFNITIPYKEDIKPYLDNFDHSAEKVGAVNVVKLNDDSTKTGYNTDYYGFKKSLEIWADLDNIDKALILGTGGAAKAIIAAMDDLNISYKIVSRSKGKADLTYDDLLSGELIKEYPLIINCTPLGTYPDIETKPDLPYEKLEKFHHLYDLVYNPEVTAFLNEGQKRGAKIKNGLEMLQLQAEKSWEIWNS